MANDRICTVSKAGRALLPVGVGVLALLAACVQQSDTAQGKNINDSKNNVAYFGVLLFSYLDRPIFDVYLNGKDIGVAGPFGGEGGLMTGVAVPLGPQVISLRLGGPEGMPRNGDTVKAKNQPMLALPDPKMKYLGVYIYPDNTAEIQPSQYWPETTGRGDKLYHEWKKHHAE